MKQISGGFAVIRDRVKVVSCDNGLKRLVWGCPARLKWNLSIRYKLASRFGLYGSQSRGEGDAPITRLIVPTIETASLINAADALGVSARPLGLQGYGLSVERRDQDSISLREYFQLVRTVMERADDETLGMSQRSLAPGTTDFILDILFQADDLEEAMKKAAQTYNLIHGGYFNVVSHRNGRLVYSINDSDFPFSFKTNDLEIFSFMEGVLIFLHAMLCLVTAQDITPHLKCVRTRRVERRGYDGFLSFWSAPVRCGSNTYTLEYDEAVAHIPIPSSIDPVVKTSAVYDMVSRMIAEREERVAPNDLKQRIVKLLKRGVMDQSTAARELGVSVATLRRRLSQASTSFREIKQATLNEMAKAMLEQGRPVIVVAETLHYVDVRSFSRAFKAWNGFTPKAYLRHLQEQNIQG